MYALFQENRLIYGERIIYYKGSYRCRNIFLMCNSRSEFILFRTDVCDKKERKKKLAFDPETTQD